MTAHTHPRYASVLGLGFGDCGKGLFTDFLCRSWQAHTVVRFNGGAQAGHNVVLPDGTHHTFSQFGSGTFIRNVYTVLASPVVVHPFALLVENSFLEKYGVTDALNRMRIDARCRIITPYHQAAGRLRELFRGDDAHGTCGVGVGETVGHALRFPEEVLFFGDLYNRKITIDKLEAIRRRLLKECTAVRGNKNTLADAELQMLRDESVSSVWYNHIGELLKHVRPSTADEISERLNKEGCVIFEGAQGLLLDENRGFHPHTTWSSTHADALDELACEYALPEPVSHYGVMRTYMTRHGSGPFPTHDPALHAIPEPHNSDEGWQGVFRRGHADEVMLRYALSHGGNLSGLLVSHLDVFDKGPALRWCSSYDTDNCGNVAALPVCSSPDQEHQSFLTALLNQARPVYDTDPVNSADACMRRISDVSGLPLVFGSYGNTHTAVYSRGAR